METVYEKRMEIMKEARKNQQRKRWIAMEVVDFLATKELTIADVKDVLDKAYCYALDKAVLK